MNGKIGASAVAFVVALFAAPVAAQISITSDPVAQHVAVRGDRYDGALVIRNMSANPQTVRVLQTDYAFAADGRASFADPGSSSRSNARWIAFSPREMVVPARATGVVHYTVSVPDTTDLRGTYWSLLIVEPLGVPSPSATKLAGSVRGDVELTVVTRYATQVATHVSGGSTAHIEIDSVRAATLPNGHRGLRFDFANSGERASGMTLTAELYDEAGGRVVRLTQARGLLYPGSSARQLFDVGSVAPGAYRVVITADTGGEELFGGNFRIRF